MQFNYKITQALSKLDFINRIQRSGNQSSCCADELRSSVCLSELDSNYLLTNLRVTAVSLNQTTIIWGKAVSHHVTCAVALYPKVVVQRFSAAQSTSGQQNGKCYQLQSPARRMLFYTLVSLSNLLHFIHKRSKILEKTPYKYFKSDTLNFPQNVVFPNTHKLSSILPLVVWANLLFVFLLTLHVHFSYLKSWLFSLVPSLCVSNTHEKQKTRAKRLLNTQWGLCALLMGTLTTQV